MILEGDVGWMDAGSKARGVKIKNIVYQVWDVKRWDKVDVPDIGDAISALQDLGTNQTWCIRERDKSRGRAWLPREHLAYL